jgi:hypothetical protein
MSIDCVLLCVSVATIGVAMAMVLLEPVVS